MGRSAYPGRSEVPCTAVDCSRDRGAGALQGQARAPPRRAASAVRRSWHVFRYLLRFADGEPVDPPAFVVAVPNWSVGETFTVSSGETFRILEMDAELPGRARRARLQRDLGRRAGRVAPAPDLAHSWPIRSVSVPHSDATA